MNDDMKFTNLFGGAFFGTGVLLLISALTVLLAGGGVVGAGVPALLGVVFGSVGGGFLIHNMKTKKKMKKILAVGERFTGKIYGYVEDKSFTMNGDFLVNTKVRYFDESNVEREAILITRFTKGKASFPIGATIDIAQLGTDFTWVPDSIRYEHIFREEELMDDKPLLPEHVKMIAVHCDSCSASYVAAWGYAAKCPYCGTMVNV